MRCSSPAITRWQGLRWALSVAGPGPGPGAHRLASSCHKASATPNLVHPIVFHPDFRCKHPLRYVPSLATTMQPAAAAPCCEL